MAGEFWGDAGKAVKIINEMPDFDASIKDGKLSVTKLKQPHHQKVDEKFSIVIDSAELNPEPVKNFVTSTAVSYIFFGKESLEIYDSETGRKSLTSWSQFPDYELNKNSLLESFSKASKLPYSILVTLVVFLFFYTAIFIGKIYSVLVISMIVSVFSKLTMNNWKWKEIFTITLFATTLPSILELIISLTGIEIQYIHFIALLAFMLAMIFTKEGDKEVNEDGRVV